MVFNKIREKYYDKSYADKYSYDESEKKVSVHLRLAPEIANELVDVIAVYRSYGIDKHELIKSELASLILKQFFDNLNDSESALLKLFSDLKSFRSDANAVDINVADDVIVGGVANE